MARRTVTGLEASNKREEILAVAVRAFATHGIERTTMRQIAAEVGLTDATLYHYFPSKDELLQAAFRTSTFRTEHLRASIDAAPASLGAQLRAAGGAFLQVLAHDPHWTRLVMREGMRAESGPQRAGMRPLVSALGRERTDALAAHIRAEVKRGRLRPCDPRLVAAHFFHACIGFWLSEAVMAGRVPSLQRREAYLRYVAGLVERSLSRPVKRVGRSDAS